MSGEVYVKCLREGGRSVHSWVDAQGQRGWDLPGEKRLGAWKGPVEGPLRPHNNGLHLAKKDSLIEWMTGHHYIAEAGGEVVDGLDCVVARKARLIEPLPIHADKMRAFCENQLSMLPEIIEALSQTPQAVPDAMRTCIDALKDKGLDRAEDSLSRLPALSFVRQSAAVQSYDQNHSTEYRLYVQTSKICFDGLVGVFTMAAKKSTLVDFATVISSNVANGLDALYRNYYFMRELTQRGYDHEREVAVMRDFLQEKNLFTESPHYAMRPSNNFHASVRRMQNAQILPALGL